GIRDPLVTGVQTCALPICLIVMGNVPNRLTLGVVAGVASMGLFGAAAFAALGPDLSTTVGSAIDSTARLAPSEDKRGGLKKVLEIGRASCRERVEVSGVGV